MIKEIISTIIIVSLLGLTLLYTISHLMSNLRISKEKYMDKLMKQNISKSSHIPQNVRDEADKLLNHTDHKEEEEWLKS